MKRRSAIRHLAVIAGGIALLPSCIGSGESASIQLSQITISSEQEKLLAEIAGTLIPETGTPGAKELGVHLFVLKMLDDCYEKGDQEQFLQGLDRLEKIARERYGKGFIGCSTAEREQLLTAMENNEGLPEEIATFYRIMKHRTVQGYLNSEYVMTRERVYEMAPGRYNGYYPVKENIAS